MNAVSKYIESGILELYVLGLASAEEETDVERMASLYPEVRQEIDAIQQALEVHARAHSRTPSPTVKPFLMATLDYTERLKNGEPPSSPPELHEGSRPEDYAEWLNRRDLAVPNTFEEFHAWIIGYSPRITSAIAWIRHMAPEEVHHQEYEKFLVLEGTCDIIIEDTVHHLRPGDYLAIPLHADHRVVVTSSIPCKVILQRVAA